MTASSGGKARACRACLAALCLGWFSAAFAHAFLVNTDPRAGARFTDPPREVALQFSEPVGLRGARVTVRRAGSRPARLQELRPGADGQNLLATLPPLTRGVFVVSWRVVAQDGHLSSGEFAFGVGAEGAIPGLRDNVDTVSLPWAAGSALLLVGLALALGGWVGEYVVWRGVSVPRAPIGGGAVLGALGSALHLTSLVAVSPNDAPGVLSGQPGVLAFSALLAFVASVLTGRGRLRPWAGVPLGLAALAVARQGHTGGAASFWFTPLGLAHLLLAAAWAGALLHLAQVLWSVRSGPWRETLAVGARRYADLAAWGVGPLVLLGLVLAWPQFATPGELWATRYGQLLLAKVALVLLALGVALLARTRAFPPRAASTGRLSRLVRAELLALLGVLLLSAGLVNATPPQALTAANVLGAPPLEGPTVSAADVAGFLGVYVKAAPGQVQVQVAQPSGKPAEGARVWVEGEGPGGDFRLFPRSCGRGCFRARVRWAKGETTLRVRVTDPQWKGGVAEVKLRWPPGPDQGQRLARVVEAMKRAGTFSVTERALGDAGASQPHTFPLTAETLSATDIYLGGGAEDVRAAGRDERGDTVLSLFVPGASIWYQLHVDERSRIRREVVVAPGYAVQREFRYP